MYCDMFNDISLTIKYSTPFQKDEVKNVQERWANLILELIEANAGSS